MNEEALNLSIRKFLKSVGISSQREIEHAVAKAEGPIYYRHDSHWAPRGALAAFHAIVEADGHPDWRFDQASVLAPFTNRKGGDLARMLGVQDNVTEGVEELKLPAGEKEPR